MSTTVDDATGRGVVPASDTGPGPESSTGTDIGTDVGTGIGTGAGPGAGLDTGPGAGTRVGSDLALWRRHPVALACVLGAIALLAHASAYALGWSGHRATALTLFYLGLVVLVVPFSWLLTAASITTRARLGGSVAYGVALYLSWMLTSPVVATRFDETLHVTTLLRLLDDGLFATNAMLPVSPHYPGLELAAAGLVWLTGLPLVVAQVLVAMVARVVLVVALFALGTRIGRSSRVGSTAVLLYSGSAHFYFFNAQFSYQTVAVAMLIVAVALLLQASDAAGRRVWLLMAATQGVLAALTITHHLTSWLTLIALWVVAGLLALGGERRRARLTLITAELATVFAALWTTVVAPLLVRYLVPLADNAGVEIGRLLTLDSTGSRAVLEAGGNPTPLWQVVVMAASILLWCALIVPSVLAAVRGTTVRRSSARLVLVGLAAAYPLLYAVRFFPTAAEIADRASTFVTMAAALLVALWIVPRLARLQALVAPAAVLLVLGGILLGGGQDWQRVPGPYLPGAEQRSVDGTTLAFARWAGRYLPDGARVASDVTVNRVLPTLAPVTPVTQQSGSENLTPVFLAPMVDEEVVGMLQDAEVDFVVVDSRTIDQPALSSSYYEAGSAFGEGALRPSRQMLLKFEGAPGFDRVLDGAVVVWDVRSLRGEPRVFADRRDPGLPGGSDPVRAAFALVLIGGLVLLGLVLTRGRTWARWLADAADRRLWVLALVLPAAMLLGACAVLAGITTGAPAWTGSLLLGVLVVLGLAVTVRSHGRHPGASPADAIAASPFLAAAAAATAALVLVAVLISTVSSWSALMNVPLPPPPGSTQSGTQGGTP